MSSLEQNVMNLANALLLKIKKSFVLFFVKDISRQFLISPFTIKILGFLNAQS